MKLRGILKVLLLGALIWLATPTGRASDEVQLPRGVEFRDYTGWRDCIWLSAIGIPAKAVIVPAVGGRVVNYSFNGKNILLENPASAGRTMGADLQDLWLGGYQCDVGPQAPGQPDHLRLLQGRAGWDLKDPFAAHVTSIPYPDLGVVMDKNFLLDPDSGALGIVQRVRNISETNIYYYLRDRTLCNPGGFIFFPLNKESRFHAGWSQRREAGGEIYYDGAHPYAPQARVLRGVLVIAATGDVTQLGADDTAGWMAYVLDDLLFVKYFPCEPYGLYPEGGNTVEVYFGQHAVELSPLSPETRLAPGQEYTFPEKWLLLPLPKPVTTPEEVRKLVKKIPLSPFAR